MKSPLRTVAVKHVRYSPGKEHTPFGDGGIESRYSKCRITWGRTKALHTNEPWWWGKWWNRESLDELWREIPGSFFVERGFELFAFVIHLAKARQRRLCLKFEERVVKLLIVNVDFTHLRLDTLAGLGLERHVCFLFFNGVALRRDASIGNVGRKLKRWFLDAAFPLQVVTLGTPMRRNGDGVAITLEVEKKSRISSGDVCPLYDLGLCDELLELCNRKAIKLALLLLRKRFLLCLGFRVCLARHFIVGIDDLALGW